MKRTPCVVCGTPHAAGQPCPRCGTGTLTHNDEEYRRNARIVRAHAVYCHLCGQAFKPGDRIEVDHIVELASGGSHAVSNLAAAHRKCNRSKGANGLDLA